MYDKNTIDNNKRTDKGKVIRFPEREDDHVAVVLRLL